MDRSPPLILASTKEQPTSVRCWWQREKEKNCTPNCVRAASNREGGRRSCWKWWTRRSSTNHYQDNDDKECCRYHRRRRSLSFFSRPPSPAVAQGRYQELSLLPPRCFYHYLFFGDLSPRFRPDDARFHFRQLQARKKKERKKKTD